MLDAATPDRVAVAAAAGANSVLAGLGPASKVVDEAIPAEIGRRFGDYLLERQVAHGGMGVVYRARQLSLDRVVALKLLLLGRYSSADSIERFRREAQSAAALRHGGIVAIHEVGEHDGQSFFSMEFVDGKNLAEILHAGPLPAARAAEYALDIAEAIHYAHTRGVLHRDLKPSNVLIDQNGHVRITDFGLAKKLDGSSDLTVTGQLVGTPNYLSPEAAAGRNSEVGPASDVYAIGALLYELLTGRPPFLAQSLAETLLHIRDTEPVALRALNPDVPRDLETIALKCLEKTAARRYASAAALAGDLGRWLRHEPILARPASALERAAKWTKRRPALASAVAGIALALVLGFSGVLWQWRLAVTQRELTRENLYVSDIYSASRALAEGNLGLARTALARAAPTGSESDLRGFEWHFLSVAARGHEIASLPAHTGVVSAITFSPDGTLLASGSWDRSIRLWRVVGREDATQSDSDFAKTAKTAAKQERALPTRALPPFALEPLHRLAELPDAVLGLSISSDGKRLLAGGNGWLQQWDLTTFQPTGQSTAADRPASGIYPWLRPTFAPDGSGRIAIGFGASDWGYRNGGDVDLWRPETGERLNLIAAGGRPVFTRDARWLATGGNRGDLKIWNVASATLLRTIACGGNVIALAFSPDADRVACATWEGHLGIWDTQTGNSVRELRGARMDRTRALAFSPDGATLASGGADQLVRVWQMADGKEIAAFRGHESEVWSLAYSSDGKSIVSGGADGALLLWSTTPKSRDEQLARVSLANGDRSALLPWGLGHPLVSPDGRYLAAAVPRARQSPFGSAVAIWDFRTLEPVVQLDRESYPIAFAPDGKILITVSEEPVCRFWDVASQRCVGEFPYGNGGWHVEAPAIMSPSGSLFAFGRFAGPVTIWDPFATRVVTEVGEPKRSMYTCAFSSDERWLAYLNANREIHLLDRATLRDVHVLRGHSADVVHVTFSPDSGVLASCGRDGTIRLWNVADGSALATLAGHRDAVNRVAFAPDGRLLASGSQDRTVKFWHLATRRELASFEYSQSITHVGFSPAGDALLIGEGANGPLHVRRVAAMNAKARSDALRPDNWSRLLDAARANLAVGKRLPVAPPRDSRLDPRLIDLSAYYNAGLTRTWGISQTWDDLSDLEAKQQTFSGVAFDVRGAVILRSSHPDSTWPERVEGIAIGRECSRVHFLHAAGARPAERAGVTIGSYIFHFADGSTLEQAIVMGRNVGAWHADPATIRPEAIGDGPRAAWSGSSAYSRSSGKVTALFATTWENPRPAVRVERIDLISAKTRSEPLLVAITLE
jgi:eukaryotic-like serine/threonine-protein kinase